MILLSSLALVRLLLCLLINLRYVSMGSNRTCKTGRFTGFGGRSSSTTTCPAGRTVLHGPNIHCDLLPRDVDQVAGSRIQKVFHERLVLARFYHRHGKSRFPFCLSDILTRLSEIFDFVQLSGPVISTERRRSNRLSEISMKIQGHEIKISM